MFEPAYHQKKQEQQAWQAGISLKTLKKKMEKSSLIQSVYPKSHQPCKIEEDIWYVRCFFLKETPLEGSVQHELVQTFNARWPCTVPTIISASKQHHTLGGREMITSSETSLPLFKFFCFLFGADGFRRVVIHPWNSTFCTSKRTVTLRNV